MTETVKYRGWEISKDYIGYWFQHPDFDVENRQDIRGGRADTAKAARQEVDALIAELFLTEDEVERLLDKWDLRTRLDTYERQLVRGALEDALVGSSQPAPSGESSGAVGEVGWSTVKADAAHYLDNGATKVLCDRLPSPVTLVLKNPVLLSGAFLPSAAKEGFPSALADRAGTSAALTTESTVAAQGGAEAGALETAHNAMAEAIAFLGRGPGGTNAERVEAWGRLCEQVSAILVPADAAVRAALVGARADAPAVGEVMREALERVLRLERWLFADVRSAHSGRGAGASSEMRSDDRDDYAEMEASFSAARAALSASQADTDGDGRA